MLRNKLVFVYSKFRFLKQLIQAEPTINDESVTTLSEASRDCLLDDERPPYPDWPFGYYTRSACILYCRALAQMSRCNCTHHFLAKIGKFSIRLFEGAQYFI